MRGFQYVRPGLSFDNTGLKSKCEESVFSVSADHEVQACCPDHTQNRVVCTLLLDVIHNIIIPQPVASSRHLTYIYIHI